MDELNARRELRDFHELRRSAEVVGLAGRIAEDFQQVSQEIDRLREEVAAKDRIIDAVLAVPRHDDGVRVWVDDLDLHHALGGQWPRPVRVDTHCPAIDLVTDMQCALDVNHPGLHQLTVQWKDQDG